MITALPDVKTLTIDTAKDQFMVLACDGIWNFMSSQDVCDFIVPRLTEGRDKLSQICEEVRTTSTLQRTGLLTFIRILLIPDIIFFRRKNILDRFCATC